MSTSAAFGAPIPISEIETVLAWVDSFKLSRPTKKINRDFSDAVLLAEILAVHYPKLVEMHNYPPRNSHALKLNNWMTLNRKVLKKLKLNLCCNTMEQLANSTPGIIERVLIMVRDKIRRDEELERSTKENEANASSGGSYYEACGDDEGVLVVPVKMRVNGVLETLQQKVVSHETYLAVKEELKDAKDVAELLKQKVDHLDNLIKLKDERISDLQKQLERKQSRRKDIEIVQNSLNVPFDDLPSPAVQSIPLIPSNKTSAPKIPEKINIEAIKVPEKNVFEGISEIKLDQEQVIKTKSDHNLPTPKISVTKIQNFMEPNLIEVGSKDNITNRGLEVDRIKSDVFKEATGFEKVEDEFKDSENIECVTIDHTIQKELEGISKLNEMTAKVLNDMPA